ncbi:MAG: hypothetical protein F6K28_57095 [Microcoleus sp. SIO2G3]|nr:hypothetical protein [Microcoleus sp. SIO2G3]
MRRFFVSIAPKNCADTNSLNSSPNQSLKTPMTFSFRNYELRITNYELAVARSRWQKFVLSIPSE